MFIYICIFIWGGGVVEGVALLADGACQRATAVTLPFVPVTP